MRVLLTFQDGQFILVHNNATPTDKRWRPLDSNSSCTNKMELAAQFKSIADSKTKNLINKFQLKSVTLPLGGVVSPKHETLFPFQKDLGVPHILSNNRSYLAHQPGLGKTAQALCAVNSKPGRTFIVAPSFLKTTWAREITKWFIRDFPDIAVIPESEKQIETNWNSDFLICSDAMLIKDWVRDGILKHQYKFFFVDEAHRFKEPTSKRTLALFGGNDGKISSPGLIYKSEHVCMLSGTPMLGKTIELWPILYAMAPETIDFMSYTDFGFRYGKAIQNKYGWIFTGSRNEEDLKKRITNKFMQVVKKKDVLKDLPEKIREVILIDNDTRSHELKKLDYQLVNDLELFNRAKLENLGVYATLRHETGLSKVSWVSGFVTNILASDLSEQIILFAWHRDVVASLAESLAVFKPMVINGGVEDEVRTKYEDAFQSGERRLIIGNIAAMNLGLTLTAATRVVFAEYDWTPANNEQAEDRANRIGSKWSVFCQYLVLPDSFDYTILNSDLEKEQSVKKVI